MMKKPDEIMKGLESLDKMQFFMGQRAGRELWNNKPYDVQERDIEGYNRDVETVRSIIQQLEAEREELIAGVVNIGGICSLCKHGLKRASQEPCNNCRALLNVKDSFFEWRGVQKEG